MVGTDHGSPVDRNLPELSVIGLSEARKEDGIDSSLSSLVLYVVLVVYDSVHKTAPINESCSCKQVGGHALGILIDC